MQMLYNSDSYVVVEVEVPGREGGDPLARGGYEIVDKFARKGIFIEGALAQRFRAGVEALAGGEPTEEAMDDYIARYAHLANQPLTMH
jgi:hypothetical protein